MTKIIYVNNKQLTDPRVRPILDANSQHNWMAYNQINTAFHSGMNTCYNRIGDNCMPFKDDIVDLLDFRAPAYDPGFQTSFEEITDARCHELRQEFGDREWLIMWSGGVDSTTVVTSILKNSTAAERANIYIALNKISVYENPRFFYDFIKPNFKIFNSSNLDWGDLLETYCIIDGEAGDQLHNGGSYQKMLYDHPEYFDRNCHNDPDGLINYLSFFADRKFGEWYYEKHMANIKSQNCPVETYHDFGWWHQFNYCWLTIKLRTKSLMKDSSPDIMKKHLANHVQWFSTKNYQRWAMVNNQPGIKYGKTLGDHKLEMKRYIYSLDRNEFYLKFKDKTPSVGRKLVGDLSWFCMLDDYSHLSLDTDLDQILELLPDHIIP